MAEYISWQALQDFLQGQYVTPHTTSPLALAFSGGLDSRFLAHALRLCGCDVRLYHATGPHIPQAESAYAKAWAHKYALPIQIFTVDVCALPYVQDNNELRCYYCKKHLMQMFKEQSTAQGRLLCDGTNADDLQAHRPGLRALQELDILSPLALCGLSKANIRHLAATTSLENPEQKASPCLLTRLHYGKRVTPHLLARIDAAETALHAHGIAECRLRLRPFPELPVLQILPCTINHEPIRTILAQHGFENVHIVQEKSLSGYFDRK